MYTSYNDGFVAPEDIVVYKKLEGLVDGTWIISSRKSYDRSLVTLDSEIKRTPIIREEHNRMIINVITQANTMTWIDLKDNERYFKSIIPKGTRFWISDNLRTVISERLYVTSEVVRRIEKTDLGFLYLPYCLDLLTRDGWRISWGPEVNLKNIRGIFIFDSKVMSLTISNGKYSDDSLLGIPDKITSKKKAEDDLSGRERTRYLRENQPDMDILKILPKDSYIPSYGELLRAVDNLLLINLTRKALGFDVIDCSWIWSSTPYNDNKLWCIEPNGLGFERYDHLLSFNSNFHLFPFIEDVYI